MENKKERTTDDIIIYAATNEKVINAIESISKDLGIETVRLIDKLLTDYLNSHSKSEKQENKTVTMEEFINNLENRKAAEVKAFDLWNILTNNAKTDLSLTRIFTKSEIINKTNLSNKKLGELLELFELFGLVSFIKGNYEFRFCFGQELQRAEAYADIVDACSVINIAIERYKSMYSEGEERDKIIKELQDNMKELIRF